MNKLICRSLFFLFLGLGTLSAQRQLPIIFEDAAALTARYDLDQNQVKALGDILEQRQNNFAALQDAKGLDELTYWQKRKNIYVGEQTSMRMMLKTPEQLAAFGQLKQEVRLEESRLIKSLIAEGHSKQEARLLLLQRKY